MILCRPIVVIAALLLALGGCRSISRDVSTALPGWLRSETGEDEKKALGELLQSRAWTEEDLADQQSRFDAIQSQMQAKKYQDALDGIDEYLELYPHSTKDEELRFLKGVAHEAEGEYDAAFKSFRSFSEIYVVSKYYPRITDLLFEIGKGYIEGKHPSFLGLFSNRDEGETILNFVVETFPTGRRAADAQWLVAEYHRHSERWRRAAAAYEFLSKTWADSPHAKPSLYWRAACLYRMVKGTRYDPAVMKSAQEAYETYLRVDGEGEFADRSRQARDELEELRAKAVLDVGEWYLGQGKAYSARFYFMRVRVVHPRTKAAARAKELLSETLPKGELLPGDAATSQPQEAKKEKTP